MFRLCIALLLICGQSSLSHGAVKDIETMLVKGSKFLFQDQVGKKKLWHYNSRFKDDSQADCGAFNFEFCFYGRQDAVMSVLLRRNYSDEEISKIIHAREDVFTGLSLDCTGFTKKECLQYSGQDLEIFIPTSTGYSFKELDDIARRNFDAARTWMSCEGLSALQCKKLATWDIQLDVPSSYTKKELVSLVNFAKYPERLFIEYGNNLKDTIRLAKLGASFNLPHDLSEKEHKEITNNLEKKATFKVLLKDLDMGAYLKGSSFYPGLFRWK